MFKKISACALLLSQAIALDAQAAARNFSLTIGADTLTITGNGGTTLNIVGYADGAALPSVPGPMLTVNEGDSITVTVNNAHTANHNFVINNVTTDSTVIAPGATKVYTFTAPTAGTYLYSDTLNNNVNREMGLYGAFIVRPADNSNTVWSGGPAYSFERTWVLSEMDKTRWNDVAASGGTVDTSIYKPNYFMMNGLGGFDAMMDSSTMIHGMVGETALVRIVNTGQFSDSLHFHGNHFQVVSINGVRQSTPFEEWDTINVPPMSVAEVLYPLNQMGEFPMHVHTAQMETANGVYLNGAATMIMMH